MATAKHGGRDEAPFAFERAAEGSFIASLCEGSGEACSTVLVVVDGANVHVRWVGALEALVLREGEVLHRTAPHLFWLEPPRRAPGTDLAGPWPVEPGDLVLLCSAKIHQVLSASDVSALASRDDLATIVRGLVTTTSTRGDFEELFAAAIRIG